MTTIDDAIKFTDIQKNQNDTVFSTISNFNTANNLITNDKDYGKPDKSQYIFSTMGPGLLTIHPNNMKTPIRTKSTLNGYSMTSKLSSYINSKHIPNGVYIVEYFNYYNDTTSEIEEIIKYYLDGCSNLEFSTDISKDLIEIVGERKGNRLPSEVRLRVITFIPEKEILEHTYVNIPSTGVVISRGNIRDRVLHPNSRNFMQSDTSVSNKNTITIDIVNNDAITPYYIKVGNEVHKLFSRHDMNRQNYCSLDIIKNGNNTIENKVDLKDINSLGIFLSKDEAITNGDVGKLYDVEKLTVEKNKLILEKDKIDHQYRVMELELRQIKEKHIMDMDKKDKEYSLMLSKSYVDMVSLTTKMTIDMVKAEHDILVAEVKHGNEKLKNNLDVFGKLLTLITTGMKLL